MTAKPSPASTGTVQHWRSVKQNVMRIVGAAIILDQCSAPHFKPKQCGGNLNGNAILDRSSSVGTVVAMLTSVQELSVAEAWGSPQPLSCQRTIHVLGIMFSFFSLNWILKTTKNFSLNIPSVYLPVATQGTVKHVSIERSGWERQLCQDYHGMVWLWLITDHFSLTTCQSFESLKHDWTVGPELIW